MITWLLRNRINAFEARYDYDMSYVRAVLDASPRAARLYAQATRLGSFRRGVPTEVYTVAQLVSVLHEDCGPCVQLGVKMAEEMGVSPAILQAVVSADFDALPEQCALAARFAQAVLTRDAQAETLRERVEARYGKVGVVALACGMTVGRLYPTMKYALGFGKACTRVKVGGKEVVPAHREAISGAAA